MKNFITEERKRLVRLRFCDVTSSVTESDEEHATIGYTSQVNLRLS